jgi:hypothetical protein
MEATINDKMSDQRVRTVDRIAGHKEAADRILSILEKAKDAKLWLATAMIAVAVYASELSSFTLSIDEELHAYNSAAWHAWLAQGRWGMSLFSWVLPQFSNVPFVGTAIFVAGLVISSVLLSCCLTKSKLESIAFSALFVSCPIWLHIGQFNTLSAGFAAGLVSSSLAVVLLQSGSVRAALLAGLIGGFAVGVYQSFVLLIVAGSLLGLNALQSSENQTGRTRVLYLARILGPMMIGWTVSVVFYFLATTISLAVSNTTITYVDRMIRIDELLSPDSALVAIGRANSRIASLALGLDPTFVGWGVGAMLMAWLGAFSMLGRTIIEVARNFIPSLLSLMLFAGAVICAVLPLYASAGDAPLRALTTLPLLYAVVSASLITNHQIARLSLIVLGYAVVVNAWIGAALFHADAVARERDRSMATQIAERIVALPGYDSTQTYRLVVVGHWAHEVGGPAIRVEVFGASFFEHDGGNPWRIVNFLRLQGVKGLVGSLLTDAREDVPQFEQLPSWPQQGSVALLDGKIVLKLGPLSYAQRAALGRNQ